MNHREHFHSLKVVAYFQPSLLKIVWFTPQQMNKLGK